MADQHKGKTLIGSTEKVQFPTLRGQTLCARIDTGAHSSSIWATVIEETEAGIVAQFASDRHDSESHTLTFDQYQVVHIRSSMGHRQVRYKVQIPVVMRDRRILASFTLADRSRQAYPVLIGRSTLNGKFVVDVSQGGPEPDEIKKEQL